MARRIQSYGWRADTDEREAASIRAPQSGTRRVASPTKAIQHLVDRIAPTAEAILRQAASSYVGRTANPAARLLRHYAECERSHLVTLFWSSDIEEIQQLESALIQSFQHRLKQVNETDRSAGRVSRRTPWNCVYLSWSWKRDATKSVAGPFDVIHGVEWHGEPPLRRGRDVHPPQFLRVPARLDQEDAADILREAYPPRRR